VLVACLGDVMLDVLVEVPGGLVPDDDTPASIRLAAGGQAANVATWVTHLGGEASVFGPTSGDGPAAMVMDALRAHGVRSWGPGGGKVGTVVSVIDGNQRSLATDATSLDYLGAVHAGEWLRRADWLFVSGYALFRSQEPRLIVETAAVARAMGTRVAIDLASAAMIRRFGSDAFASLCRQLRPDAIFANDAERTTMGFDPAEFDATDLVLKHGPGGATFVIGGALERRAAPAGPVVDATGAGDALTAGYLLGGPDLAMEAAASCVGMHGGQPTRA
jgi:ribokinase